WYRVQSLDKLTNISNIVIYEVEPEPPVVVIPTEIHLVQSPFYIKYTDVPNFNGLLIVRLYIWAGAYVEKPVEPNYSFSVNGSSYIE
ncbi:hypothetical protein, partial [Bacillus sp. SIMBA_005]|uniref:hypothetical protein n=1 Tax=Bacillus sp. SIMBA_005 TaxID=3085754 RepID=UPI00397C5138